MAVTVTADLVKTITADPARPPGHAGWNNPYGDPSWNADVDWYRRVQLVCTGDAGEVGTVVNWELFDGTIPVKTSAEIAATTAGTVASPFGPLVNNVTTWTVWATTGSAAAASAKYADTKSACIPTLRANGPRVQVVLGRKKAATAPAETWTAYAFLPGGGKTYSGSDTVDIGAPVAGQTMMVTHDQDDPGRVTFDIPGAPGATLWDFGDGNEKAQHDAHTVHWFTESGTYEVRAVGETGIATTSIVEITIPEEQPPAGDDATAETASAPTKRTRRHKS